MAGSAENSLHRRPPVLCIYKADWRGVAAAAAAATCPRIETTARHTQSPSLVAKPCRGVERSVAAKPQSPQQT